MTVTTNGTPVIVANAIAKTYFTSPPVKALSSVHLDVWPGERVVIFGHSGSGKSTLLNIIGLLDTPTAGSYELLGRDIGKMQSRERDILRAEVLGFVFQEAHVLGHRTVEENVALKLAINRIPRKDRRAMVDAVLARVGLEHRRAALGRLLSGGEKQRLAIARAVATGPRIILADEPTGNLDEVNSTGVLAIFDDAASRGVAVVVITHDQRIARWADRSLSLSDGQLAAA